MGVIKLALSSNDDKGLQTSDRITSFPYDASVEKMVKNSYSGKIND